MPITPPWQRNYTEVGATFDEGVLTLTMRRPAQLNAMTFTMIGELTDALYQSTDLDAVRVIAITGEGDRAFSSGDDLVNMGAGPEQRGAVSYNSRTHHHVMIRTIRRIPKPVVALLKGYCLGAGFDLALACDIRLAAGNLAMGDQRPVRAIATLSGSSWFLPRLVGAGRATELLLTGRRANAVEAERIGMVNFVYPLDEFDTRAGEYVGTLARMPTYCLGTNKANIEFGLTNGLEAALAWEADRFAVNRRTDDAREGGLSFRERREPRYTGRPPGPPTEDEIPF